jgi:cytochrome c biogenesis protein
MKRLFDTLSSVHLTLVVLLGLSVVAIGGTIWPVQQGEVQRFELYYQSVWFRLLLGLLVVNLASCTLKTWQRSLGAVCRLQELLQQDAVPAGTRVPLGDADPVALRQQCAEAGYRLQSVGNRLLGRRGLVRFWAVPVLHVAILAVIFGAWASQLGFVGTLTLYVSHQADSYFDWGVEEERPIGFTFRLDHFEPRYYPIDLKFAVIDPVTRQMRQEFTAREGETVALSDGLTAQILRFFPEEQHLVLDLHRDGQHLGEYHTLSGPRSYPNEVDPGVLIKPTAFKDPLLKQMHSEVSILENGRVVRQGVIEINHPLVHNGIAIYQTAYNRDESGFWAGGYQLSKDPGEPVVWVASIILSLALLLLIFIRYRVVALIPVADGWALIGLSGFRGDTGKEDLQELAVQLTEETHSE